MEQVKELQEFFKTHDFTETISVGHKPQVLDNQAEIFKRAKKLFTLYWLQNLPGLGINRAMKNFSNDYPIKLLQNADADHFSERILEIASDSERFVKEGMRFVDMYEEPLCAAFEAYCENNGKDIDDLTDEETASILDKVAGAINEELIKALMIGQRVPEIYGVSHAIQTHEDFNVSLPKNFDLINFQDKWTHCKTKLGAPLFFCDFTDEEMVEIEGARDFFNTADDHTLWEYKELRDSFANTLNSTDREIYYLREQGYTQTEIAERLGYKTHSAVTKRMKEIREKLNMFLKATDYYDNN